jgi:hypothetical protein
MSREFVEQRGGSFYFIGSRVALALIVHEFKNGDRRRRSGRTTLTLEQVYGAITFYLGNIGRGRKRPGGTPACRGRVH